MHARHRVHVEPQLPRHELGRRADGRDVRLLAQVARLHAEQQVDHRRVAGDGHLVDLARLDAVALAQLLDQVVDGLDGELVQTIQATLALGVDDAADDVLAAGDLLVVGAGRVDHASGREVEQVGDDAGGAEVDGEAHAGLRERRRVDAQQARRQVAAVHPVAHLERHGDLPVGVAQRRAQVRELGQLGAELLDAVLLLQSAAQPVEVRRLVVERRRLDVQLEQPHRRVLPVVAGDGQRLGLGDGVSVRPSLLLAPLRHLDLDGALAGVGLAGDGPPLEDVGARERGAAAPLHLAAHDAHLAAAAASLPRARGRDVQLAEDRRVEQARASGHLYRLAGRRERDVRHRRPGLGRGLVHEASFSEHGRRMIRQAPQTFLM